MVSGPWSENIYEFLRDGKKIEEPSWLRERMETEDPNFVIGTTGEDGSCELTAKVLEVFTGCYGAECGNMGLKLLAHGGVYLGGGIPPKILKTLQNGPFRQAFLDKGRLSPLLHTVPVRVILGRKVRVDRRRSLRRSTRGRALRPQRAGSQPAVAAGRGGTCGTPQPYT